MEAVRDTLRSAATRKGISQRELGDRIGRSQPWVSHHFDGSYVLSVEDFIRICAGIRIDPVDTLRAALNK
jgi:transcriptional regulator with XRE-family HTH domain